MHQNWLIWCCTWSKCTGYFSLAFTVSHLVHRVYVIVITLTSGQADLTCLYGLIANNFSWLERQFDIQFILPSSGVENIPQFTLSSEVDEFKEFNACKEYEMIGTRKFDHVRYFRYLSKTLRHRLNLTHKLWCILKMTQNLK